MRLWLLLLLLVAGEAHAADLTLGWTNPCTNAIAGADTICATEGDSLRDLHVIRFRLVRFKDPTDTLVLDVPGVTPCLDAAVAFDIEPGSMGWAAATAVDWSNQESCSATYVFALPAQDFVPGLKGDYYDNSDMTGFKMTRTDSKIDFDWDLAAPDVSMGIEQFSIVWTGFLTAALTGTYAFHARIEDGCKLWVGPKFVISDWGINNEHEGTGYADLVGGTRYAFRMEYFANNGTAIARLSWTPPGGVKAVIPAEAFSR
jgi:hypothetical protein